jgi:hypothetical protein
MITGAIRTSILHEKAKKRKVANIAKAPYEIRIELYRETLIDLEKYLDIGDLRKLTTTSLGIIRDDILEIIGGVRDLHSIPLGKIVSLIGTLNNLRKARTNLQTAIGMYSSLGKLKENKSEAFFERMEMVRESIEKALEFFKPNKN